MSKSQIEIDAKVLFEMQQYAAYAKYHFGTEIAGWGHYSPDNGIYKLAPLTEQTVSGAEVDNFPNDILNDTKYDISDMIVQWHSHVDMGVTPSGVDIKQIKDTLELMPALISIIVNCKGQYSARLDFRKASSVNLTDNLTVDLELIPYYDDEKVSKDVLDKLRKPEPKIVERFIPKHCYYGIEDYQDKTLFDDTIYQPPNQDIWLDEDKINAIAIFHELGRSYTDLIYNVNKHSLVHNKTGKILLLTETGIQYDCIIGGIEIVELFLQDTVEK